MLLTGAQILWESLVREGVDTVFGYPGGAILPAYDAMLDYPIRHVLVRHEQGAAHMADGYARASGKVGVAVATSGPGATNLTTGIATAMLDSIPTVFITGQVSVEGRRHRRLPGDRRHRHHPADHEAQLRWSPTSRHLARTMREAFVIAQAGPARARCWSTSARTRSRPRPSSSGPRPSTCPASTRPQPPTRGDARARRWS